MPVFKNVMDENKRPINKPKSNKRSLGPYGEGATVCKSATGRIDKHRMDKHLSANSATLVPFSYICVLFWLCELLTHQQNTPGQSQWDMFCDTYT